VAALPFGGRRLFECAPLWRQWYHPKLTRNLPGGKSDDGRERGIGQLQLSQLLYPHVRRHARRNHLQNLDGLFAYDVCAEQARRGGGDDQLAEPFRVLVDQGTITVGVRHDRHCAVFLRASLALSETDAAILGIGKAAVRDDLVSISATGT